MRLRHGACGSANICSTHRLNHYFSSRVAHARLGIAWVLAVKKSIALSPCPFALLKKSYGIVFFFRVSCAGTKVSLLQPSSSSVIAFLVLAVTSAE
jgi:hypothetical protein